MALRHITAPLSRWMPLALAAAAGCGAADDEPAAASSAVRHVLVSQADVAALPPGERLRLDLGAARVAYHVVLQAALDTDRIVLVSAAGAEASLTAQLAEIERRAMAPRPDR